MRQNSRYYIYKTKRKYLKYAYEERITDGYRTSFEYNNVIGTTEESDPTPAKRL